MKILYTSFAFLTLMISASALAANPDADTSVTVKGTTQHIPAYISPDEAREIIGQYTLDNGKTLIMSQKQNRYYVEISGHGVTRIIPNNATTFTSGDQTIHLKFTPATDGKATRLVARYVES